jgi:hypothetical protein
VGVLQVLAEVLCGGEVIIWVRIKASTSVVIGAGDWPAAEYVGVGVVFAWPVLNCEGELLNHQHPAGGLATQVLGGHEPLQRLVVGD